MTKASRTIKKILNSKDIIYPHQLFRGLNLSEDDFLSLLEIFEKSRLETIQKYINIRNIGNSIIQKDGMLQGIYYRETARPELSLLFKSSTPVDWNKRNCEAHSEDGKEIVDSEAINALAEEKRLYQERNKDTLDEIASFNLPNYIRTSKNGNIITQKGDQYDNIYPAYVINEEVLEYLLNSVNLGSNLDIALVRDYLDELQQFQSCLDAGFFYPDFYAIDYTGNLSIKSKHDGFIALKPNNSMNIPSEFGKITVYFNNPKGWNFLSIDYTASNDKYEISSDLRNRYLAPERAFVHKTLLPEPYQKKLK